MKPNVQNDPKKRPNPPPAARFRGHGGTGAGTPLKGGFPTPQDFPRNPLAAELAGLAHRVRQLTVSHRDPERFHADKSEIEHELRQLARAVR